MLNVKTGKSYVMSLGVKEKKLQKITQKSTENYCHWRSLKALAMTHEYKISVIRTSNNKTSFCIRIYRENILNAQFYLIGIDKKRSNRQKTAKSTLTTQRYACLLLWKRKFGESVCFDQRLEFLTKKWR